MNDNIIEAASRILEDTEDNVINKSLSNLSGEESIQNESKTELSENNKEESNEISSSSWLYSLKNIDKSFEYDDFGSTYIFNRIFDPIGRPTKYTSVFCSMNEVDESGNTIWIPLNGYLSNEYNTIILNKFMEDVRKDVECINDLKIERAPFVCSCLQNTKTNISLIGDEASMFVFSFISGIKECSLNNLSATLSLNIINTYNGASSLRLYYACNISANINSTTQTFIDYFSMSKISKVIRHGFRLSELSSSIENISSVFESEINILKNQTSNVEKIVEEISESFKKKNKLQYLSIWENLVPEYRNLYYAMLIASIVLNLSYDVMDHIKVNNSISKIINRISM